jgi:hypothetical protein
MYEIFAFMYVWISQTSYGLINLYYNNEYEYA